MPKRDPLRRCTGCGEMKEKSSLIRIVRNDSPDGITYAVDRTMKAAGRGAYLCDSADCMKKAMKRKGLDRSFHGSVPKEVYEELERALTKEQRTD